MEQANLPNHPAAREENAHLQRVCDVIEEEIDKLEHETKIGAEEERVVVVPDGLGVDEQVAMNLFIMKLDTMHNLARSRRQAYFARLDFIPQNGDKETYYLGRWGVVKTPELDVEVVDWRAPIANLYYSGQIGPMDYDAPDGHVNGELTLKRMLTVHRRALEGVFDSGLVSQDAYLQGVLGAVTGDRLREIVTTIQAEQNLVIRAPFDRSLIVQGVAGSGKTTIALHRIAYLLYAQRDNLRAEQMMILAPGPLFLSYISQVLPDLGVERVRQTTFAALCLAWMGKHAPKMAPARRVEDKLCASPEEREAMAQSARRKGSIAFLTSLQAYLDTLEETMLPASPLTFGDAVLMDVEEMRELFLRQLKPWPLMRRVKEAQKVVGRRLTRACEKMRERMQDMATQRLNRLLSTLPDGPERRERAARLLDSRDARLKEIDERAKAYIRDFPKLFPSLTPLSVYRDYLTAREEEAVRAATLPLLDKKRAQQEDLAALTLICDTLFGLPRDTARHIVVDECQDLSPAQLMLLRRRFPGATFTLVGDLMQGIHEDEGTASFDAWLEPIFDGQAVVRQLITSYRATAEIMTFANRIAAKWPIPGQTLAKPVLRHGDIPETQTFATDKARLTAIAETTAQWLQSGYHTVALIEKTEQDAKRLYKALPASLQARLLREDDPEYEGGVLVLSAGMVKGLEFDCVLVCNASAEAFPNDPFLCRVLYVLCTRPLHRLTVYATGNLSPLLIP